MKSNRRKFFRSINRSCGQNQFGFALVAIVSAIAILSLMVILALQNSSRQTEIQKKSNDDLKFSEITRRLQNILDARALCTCNLKDLVILPNGLKPDGTLQDGANVMLEESSVADPYVLGFYKLDPASPDGRGCKYPPGNIDLDSDAVLMMRPNDSYKSGIHAKYFRIDRFQFFQNVSPTIKRYQAKFSYAAKDKFSIAKSNINSPIDLDVYIEVDSSGGINKIKQCFQPKVVASPVPTPPPSSPPGTCCGLGRGKWVSDGTAGTCCLMDPDPNGIGTGGCTMSPGFLIEQCPGNNCQWEDASGNTNPNCLTSSPTCGAQPDDCSNLNSNPSYPCYSGNVGETRTCPISIGCCSIEMTCQCH